MNRTEPIFRASFAYEPEDVRLAAEMMTTRAGHLTPKRMIAMTGVMIPVIASVVAFSDRSRPFARNLLDLACYAGIPMAFFVLFLIVLYYYRNRIDERFMPGILDSRIVEIRPEGLYHEDKTGEGITRWEVVEEVKETEKHIVFFLPGFSCVAVPKRAFAAPGDADAFVAEAHRYTRK